MNTQKLFQAIIKMNISQNNIAKVFGLSPSTVNAWIKKNSKPRLSVKTIYDNIDLCRNDYSGYRRDFEFINDLIESLEISEEERNYLISKVNNLKLQNFSDDICYEQFMMDLIGMSVNEFTPKELVSYNPYNHNLPIVGIGIEHIIGVREDGTVVSTGANDFQQCATHAWRDIVAVSACWRSSIGLKKDGTCIAIGHEVNGNGEIYKWNNIISIACGTSHIVGLKSNGSAVAFGRAGYGQCNVSDWKNIIAIAAGHDHSVGLKKDGTVIAAGNNEYHQCDVNSWENVTSIAASGNHTIGLTVDGTILATGDVDIFHFNNWRNITSIATGFYHVIGLKKDGTVIATGPETNGLYDIYKWWNIIAVYAGFFKTVGIKADGHVISTRDKYSRSSGYVDTSLWQIFQPKEKVDDKISYFEDNRIHVLNMLKEIRELILQYAPYINGYKYLNDNQDDINLIYNTNRIIDQLYIASKEIYELYNNILPLPPITDFILMYTVTFLDFLKTFIISQNDISVIDMPSYKATKSSYGAFIILLSTTNQVIKDLETLS